MKTSPIDLTLFHQEGVPAEKYKVADRYNACTGPKACFLLEWSGSYNYSFAERFLGHYRLYQLFKKRQAKMGRTIPLPKAYILQYRSGHWLKYFVSRLVSFLHKTVTRGEPYPSVEIEAFNAMLITRGSATLENFLIEAETDFPAALKKALADVNQPGFPDRPPVAIPSPPSAPALQPAAPPLPPDPPATTSPITPPAPRGKEKDILSKWQTLALFDLLAQSAKVEKIDFHKPNRFDAIATLLRALTGRTKTTWLDELKDHQGKDLYHYDNLGQLDQLINSLINLSQFLRSAGFSSLAKMAETKIRELERKKNNYKDGDKTT